MATVIGIDESKYLKFTCYWCARIIQYTRNEIVKTDRTDEGCRIMGLNCPNCGEFHRTNY